MRVAAQQDRSPTKPPSQDRKPLPEDRKPADEPKPLSARRSPSERLQSHAPEGTPVPDSKAELPPVIRRAEVVAFALVALLVICIVAVLYVAKAFFLPITMAFIVGTMLSPAASLLERYRIPRAVAAVLIVTAVGAGVTFMIGLIASPVMEWSNKLPELGRAAEGKAARVRPAAGAVAAAAEHARRVRRAGDASRCRNSNGCSRRWNSCRRPSPNSCCSSRP